MAKPPCRYRFTKDHEWVRLDGDIATVGITDHAQEQLGDVVFVELPEVGREVAADEAWPWWRASRPRPTSTRRSPARSSRPTVDRRRPVAGEQRRRGRGLVLPY